MKKIITAVLLFVSMTVSAQITFDTKDYANVSVYDFWEASPFRTGKLSGNCLVADNPYRDTTNPSGKVLACQRSLYGSNLYGALIELKPEQRFPLTPEEHYLHALIHKPIAGRSIAIALGKHTTPEWAHQHTDVVQATAVALNQVVVGEWTDVVFPLKGVGDIDIYSIVIVFDAESPHRLPMPFMAYIDNVQIDSNPAPRTVTRHDATTDAILNSGNDSGTITVKNSQRNGTILTASGEAFTGDYQHPRNTSLRIKSVPEKGFVNGGIYVKHGQPERTEFYGPELFSTDGIFEIPADITDTDILIEGVMIEKK